MFSGTYNSKDVTFLLKVIEMAETETFNKEKLIQSGQKHYSQMLSIENAPSKEYLEVFYQSLEYNKKRFAQDILNLANYINQNSLEKLNQTFPEEIIIVSLARAGTPVGVLINRILKEIFNKKVYHYSLSIIRDKGLDLNALTYIYKKHGDSNIFFIDGWTGKGVISKELKNSVNNFNQKYHSNISDSLYVVSDISGTADFSVTHDDYLIPSAVLNSTISGLISRTMTDLDQLKENDFHACKFYSSLSEYDLSLWFIEQIMGIIKNLKAVDIKINLTDQKEKLKDKSTSFLKDMMLKYSINNINYIKPGIGETTRVLLRRVPDRILVSDINSEDIKHLIVLAKEKGCLVEENINMPYKAVGIIAKVKD